MQHQQHSKPAWRYVIGCALLNHHSALSAAEGSCAGAATAGASGRCTAQMDVRYLRCEQQRGYVSCRAITNILHATGRCTAQKQAGEVAQQQADNTPSLHTNKTTPSPARGHAALVSRSGHPHKAAQQLAASAPAPCRTQQINMSPARGDAALVSRSRQPRAVSNVQQVAAVGVVQPPHTQGLVLGADVFRLREFWGVQL